MGKGFRKGRLGEEIRRIISEMLLREIKDPRLSSGLISVSAVDVTADGSYATCYLTVLSQGQDQEKEEQEAQILEGMYSAKGLIKKEIGKQIRLRHVPELLFKIDHSMEYGRHISQVIETLGIDHEE